MQVIKDQEIVAFDVDQTLFMHHKVSHSDLLINPYSGSQQFGSTNEKNVELLRQYKGRGKFIIVWSSAGAEWAEVVVKYYNLEPFVDLVMTKPDKLVDDLPVQEIFPVRLYLK